MNAVAAKTRPNPENLPTSNRIFTVDLPLPSGGSAKDTDRRPPKVRTTRPRYPDASARRLPVCATHVREKGAVSASPCFLVGMAGFEPATSRPPV